MLIELAVGDGDGQLSPSDAARVAEAAQRAGVTGLRLLDRGPSGPALDPSVAAAHLAGRYPSLGYLIDAPTTHNAPYNLARRILSVDRATAGRAGLVLRAGAGDEVSESVAPDPQATDAAQRWGEYAEILTGLWQSFPRAALTGDRQRAIAIDDARIHAIGHLGRFYRVAGPLDGPASEQGRPVLVTADAEAVGWSRIAALVDAVIVDGPDVEGAAHTLGQALTGQGRPRTDIALLARLDGAAVVETPPGADGAVLTFTGDADLIISTVDDVVAGLTHRRDATLRAGLGLVGAS